MKNQAFTLIELLVVILIIGILAAIAVPQYQLAIDKTKFTGLMNSANYIRNEQEVFYLANGRYADNCEELGVSAPTGYTRHETNKNKFINQGNNMYILCSQKQDSITPDRVISVWNLPKETLSYETAFSIGPEKRKKFIGKRWCYSDGDRGARVCDSLCGPLTMDKQHSCFFDR